MTLADFHDHIEKAWEPPRHLSSLRAMLTQIGYDGVPWLSDSHPAGPGGTESNLSGEGMSSAKHVAIVAAASRAGVRYSTVLTSRGDREPVARAVALSGTVLPVDDVEWIPSGWVFHVDERRLSRSGGREWRSVFCTAPSIKAIEEIRGK